MLGRELRTRGEEVARGLPAPLDVHAGGSCARCAPREKVLDTVCATIETGIFEEL